MPYYTATPLTDEQTARLARLHNRLTAYELEVVHPDGTTALFCYTQRKSRIGLMVATEGPRAIRACRFLGIDPATARYRVPRGTARAELRLIPGNGVIRFTGRTERQAIMEGELPRMPEFDPADNALVNAP